jgi:hypothetical protein
MAAYQRVPLSPTVNVCFGRVPIETDKAVFRLRFFDVHGNMVDRMSREMVFWDRKVCGGRVELKDSREMMMTFGIFGSKRE